MEIKKVGIIVCMLLITAILPLTALAGDPENPEVSDRIRDVKLFGVITFPLQMEYKNVDIVAAWLREESATPDSLFVSLQVRDLQDKTESLEAIYNVDWIWNNNRFIVNVHINPQGIGSFFVGRSLDYTDNIEEWITCDGMVDLEKNILTWLVPKEFMQNLRKGSTITSISASTCLRFTDASGLPLMDLFKDLSWNAKSSKDYVIQY